MRLVVVHKAGCGIGECPPADKKPAGDFHPPAGSPSSNFKSPSAGGGDGDGLLGAQLAVVAAVSDVGADADDLARDEGADEVARGHVRRQTLEIPLQFFYQIVQVQHGGVLAGAGAGHVGDAQRQPLLDDGGDIEDLRRRAGALGIHAGQGIAFRGSLEELAFPGEQSRFPRTVVLRERLAKTWLFIP